MKWEIKVRRNFTRIWHILPSLQYYYFDYGSMIDEDPRNYYVLVFAFLNFMWSIELGEKAP